MSQYIQVFINPQDGVSVTPDAALPKTGGYVSIQMVNGNGGFNLYIHDDQIDGVIVDLIKARNRRKTAMAEALANKDSQGMPETIPETILQKNADDEAFESAEALISARAHEAKVIEEGRAVKEKRERGSKYLFLGRGPGQGKEKRKARKTA